MTQVGRYALKFAILADSHVPSDPGTAQESALRWALCAARERGAERAILAGDMTAAGEISAADRVVAACEQSGLQWLSTLGNAELRTPEEASRVCRALAVSEPTYPVVLVDTSRGMVPEEERERVEARIASVPRVLVTHWPPDELPEDDRVWFEQLVTGSVLELLIVGHKHFDEVRSFAGRPLHLVRGLDPDKAKHELPAVAVFEHRQGDWHRQDVGFPGADPRLWPAEDVRAFLDLLGVSTMGEPVAGAHEAASLGVPVLELRAEPALAAPRQELLDAVASWRAAGGRCLSVHLPNLRWDGATGDGSGQETHGAAVALALALRADRVTAHVPRATVRDMACPAVHDCMLAVFRDQLAPLADAGVTIGIENLHRNRGEPADDGRGFGYLPDECLGWIGELRSRLPGCELGLHLDIGHARNNSPFSQRWTLGRWYAAVGEHAVGYHLHQVTAKGNHQPFVTPFAPLLSLASFFWAWSRGQLRPAPMVLEIRQESGCVSWQRLRRFLLQET